MTVKSHDGVDVPLTIISAKNVPRDGSAPLLLDAYGAYGVSQAPQFWPSLAVWLERGGVYAVAHVRGGGELGDAWHRGGYRATKSNSWRDLIAAAQWLIGERWTTPSRLALIGGSAGGLTVSNAMIERPDLFAAMVSQSGFHDTLRSETGAAGPANVPEFGTVATERGLADLLAMSSYARAAEGVAYPAALLTIGFRDARVDPWDPGKMAARLQAISASLGEQGNPVLLRVDFDAGHGTSSAHTSDETTDLFAFLLWRTGAPGFRAALTADSGGWRLPVRRNGLVEIRQRLDPRLPRAQLRREHSRRHRDPAISSRRATERRPTDRARSRRPTAVRPETRRASRA